MDNKNKKSNYQVKGKEKGENGSNLFRTKESIGELGLRESGEDSIDTHNKGEEGKKGEGKSQEVEEQEENLDNKAFIF